MYYIFTIAVYTRVATKHIGFAKGMTDQRRGHMYNYSDGMDISLCVVNIAINLFAIGTRVQVMSRCCRTSHNYFKIQIILHSL